MQPVFRSVPVSIGDNADRSPTTVALIDGPTRITYQELGQRSDAIAAALERFDVGRGGVVGVALRRSAASVIAALGVMKAGAAYLPLDPDQPLERRAFAVRDAGVAAMLSELGDQTVHFDTIPQIGLHRDGTLPSPTPHVGAAREIDETDLAYVIYTSGSTGRPKGVEITHAGLANLCTWHRRAFDVTAVDRASHASAVGFDAAVWEVWPYLCAGASVSIAGDMVARDAQALAEWLAAERITLAFVATPIAERLIELTLPPELALRTLLTGADTLHRRPRAGLPFALVNNYGPTEATVVATSGRVEPASGDDLPSIGRPIDNVAIVILDASGARQPIDREGEICIAGPGLARGYRGRPDLDAAAFAWIDDEDGTAVRVYRTGDRGRQAADGSIAFLGRMDDQIQLRGFRIEPREIEAALDAHRDTLESAVIVRSFGPDDERLIAFVVPRPGATMRHADVRAFLGERLPAYMLPATFIELPTLPLTPNGKVDRAALHDRAIDPLEMLDQNDRTHVEPRTPTEERLVQIVSTLLKRERVSIEDDFFLLGGHSLLGTQLIARIRDAFAVKIGLRQLFDAPTVVGLAAEVDRLQRERLDGAVAGDHSTPFATARARAAIPRRSA